LIVLFLGLRPIGAFDKKWHPPSGFRFISERLIIIHDGGVGASSSTVDIPVNMWISQKKQ